MSLNKCMIIGFVGQDPEVRYVGAAGNQNAKVAQFRVATTEKYRDRDGNVKENTEWHSIVAWRGLADITEKYIVKGTLLYIEGHMKLRSWEDQNGIKRFQTDIVADKIDLLGRTKDSSQRTSAPAVQSGSYTAPQSNTYTRQQQMTAQSHNAHASGPPQPGYEQQVIAPGDMPDDDLPF